MENQDAATISIPVTPAQTVEPTSPEASAAPQTLATAPAPFPFLSAADLLSLRVVSDPQISADGASIAYTIQTSERERNTTSSAIWSIVGDPGSSAGHLRQMTTGDHHDFAPRWSPDGTALAFLSDRGGTVQLYLLPLHGGEARQISHFKQGVSEYNWRPDGQALLVHSPWKAADDHDEPDNSATAVVYSRLDEQWDGVGYKQGRHEQLWLLPLEGTPTRLTAETVDCAQSCWSPDGAEIAFCANRRADPDLSASMALWVLTLATGQLRRLTPQEGLAQMPAWSPTGEWIAYYYAPDQTEATNICPWIVKADGSESPRPATQHTQNFTCLQIIIDEIHATFLSYPQWYPEGQSLLISVQERGQVHLYRVNPFSDSVEPLTSGNGCYLCPALSKHGETIALLRADWFTPGDIWRMDGDGKNRRKLTGVNDALLRSRQLVRPQRITWKSFDALDIEGWLYLPPLAHGVKAPLILEVHGGPTLAWGDSYVHEFQVLAGQGFAVLAANPRGSMGYGEEFCRKVLHNWGGDDFRDLIAGIDFVIATEPVDATNLGIGGLSYGGYMTNWAITQTDRFKAAVSRNGISDLVSAGRLSDQTIWFDLGLKSPGQNQNAFLSSRSALTYVDRINTPLLLLHAENDLRCPYSESWQLFVELRKLKKTVELVRYPGMSHMFDWPDLGTPLQRLDRLQRTLNWFAQHLQ